MKYKLYKLAIKLLLYTVLYKLKFLFFHPIVPIIVIDKYVSFQEKLQKSILDDMDTINHH